MEGIWIKRAMSVINAPDERDLLQRSWNDVMVKV
jgi:hypothetical protein